MPNARSYAVHAVQVALVTSVELTEITLIYKREPLGPQDLKLPRDILVAHKPAII